MASDLDRLLGRTLSTLSRKRLITPHFESALLRADWPPEYAIKVYNKERIWDGRFHPSSHADAEPLYLYYLFNPDTALEHHRNDPSEEMTFQIGSVFHSLMQSMFVHLGFTTVDECEVSFVNDRHNCSGTLDVRRFYLPDGTWVPVELKSASFLPKQPFARNVKQLQIYMDLGCEEPQERGVLFYIEKSAPHRTAEFVVERDEAMLLEIYTKWDRVTEALEFQDPESLHLCCMVDGTTHVQCPARFVCRQKRPTMQTTPTPVSFPA